MLFGEHAVVYGHPCIVTAIDQRINVSVGRNPRPVVRIEAPDIGVTNYRKEVGCLGKDVNIPKGVKFMETAVRNFFEKYKIKSGLEIKTKSEFSSQFGFGSSSAVTVGVTKALSELFDVRLKKQELFDLSYKTVLDIQGVGSGFDIAAAIWGGTLWFVGGGKAIVPLQKEELPTVVGYTGIKADTSTLVRQVAERNRRYPETTVRIFEAIVDIVKKAKTALEGRDWLKLGDFMNFNQGLLDALGVNTRELSNLIYAARGAGALGAKLSGAGGGDCMLALVSKGNKRKVERAIEEAGGQVIRIKNSAEGVRTE
jgi:mevalonate kinase